MQARALLLALPFAWASTSVAGGIETSAADFCVSNETVYLSCLTVSDNWIALCGTNDSLQYRSGQRTAVMMKYPEHPENAKQAMFFSHYTRALNDRIEIRFEIGEATYTVYEYAEEGNTLVGVQISEADGAELNYPCAGNPKSRLIELNSVLPCDRDSALNGGRCP